MGDQKERPTMLNAGQVAERLNMSKGFACKAIRDMNDEQEALGRPAVKGRVRSDHFERRYFAGDEDARVQERERHFLRAVLLPRRQGRREAQGEEGLCHGTRCAFMIRTQLEPFI